MNKTYSDPDPLHPIYNIGDTIYFYFNKTIYTSTIKSIEIAIKQHTIKTVYYIENENSYSEPELFASPGDLRQHLIREETEAINNYLIKEA